MYLPHFLLSVADLPEDPFGGGLLDDSSANTTTGGGFSGMPQKPQSGVKRTLKTVATNFFVGTEVTRKLDDDRLGLRLKIFI